MNILHQQLQTARNGCFSVNSIPGTQDRPVTEISPSNVCIISAATYTTQVFTVLLNCLIYLTDFCLCKLVIQLVAPTYNFTFQTYFPEIYKAAIISKSKKNVPETKQKDMSPVVKLYLI